VVLPRLSHSGAKSLDGWRPVPSFEFGDRSAHDWVLRHDPPRIEAYHAAGAARPCDARIRRPRSWRARVWMGRQSEGGEHATVSLSSGPVSSRLSLRGGSAHGQIQRSEVSCRRRLGAVQSLSSPWREGVAHLRALAHFRGRCGIDFRSCASALRCGISKIIAIIYSNRPGNRASGGDRP
jgi:hypothetical protein